MQGNGIHNQEESRSIKRGLKMAEMTESAGKTVNELL